MLRIVDAEGRAGLARAMRLSFGTTEKDLATWWETAGEDNLRVWRSDGADIGGLVDIPMGLFVGGRRVANHGVAGVAIVPEARGVGEASRMMAAYLRELHRAEVAVSTLYASTRALYRGVGYGIAGTRWLAELDARLLRGAGARSRGWRALSLEDRPRVAAARSHLLRRATGSCDRGPYLWKRVWARYGVPNDAFILDDEEGHVRAWAIYRLTRKDDGFFRLSLEDHGATDAPGLQALVGFLASQASMAREVSFPCGPHDPLLDALPEHIAQVSLYEPFLLRVTHLQRALEDRGWPVGLSTSLAFHLDDPVLPAQSGDWVLEIEAGQGRLRPGGPGGVRVGPRGLAALYTGYCRPDDLVLRGLLEASDEDCARLATAFAGPPPGMSDGF